MYIMYLPKRGVAYSNQTYYADLLYLTFIAECLVEKFQIVISKSLALPSFGNIPVFELKIRGLVHKLYTALRIQSMSSNC